MGIYTVRTDLFCLLMSCGVMKMKYREETKPLNYDDAKEKALRYLEFRSHSEKELSDKLRRAGADDDIIQQIMTFLREYKLVNDLDYARRYSRD